MGPWWPITKAWRSCPVPERVIMRVFVNLHCTLQAILEECAGCADTQTLSLERFARALSKRAAARAVALLLALWEA